MGKQLFARSVKQSPPKGSTYAGRAVTTQPGGLREVSSAQGRAEISIKTCVNVPSPGVHKPKAWLASES